jgi:hypothetical protein
MAQYIFIQTRKSNVHAWKNAPDVVAFLRHEHRHEFHFRVQVEVFHEDREIEFFIFKQFIEDTLDNVRAWRGMSCEMIASWLIAKIGIDYPGRRPMVEVSEDGENGAIVC